MVGFFANIGKRLRKYHGSSMIFIGLRVFLGAVFVYASYDKILHPQQFSLAVFQYQLLPDELVNLVALALPWLELLIGVLLIVGVWMPGAALTAFSLLCAFIIALVINGIRGLDVHCGCFSTEATAGPAGVATILRDVAFLLISLVIVVATLYPEKLRRWRQTQERRNETV